MNADLNTINVRGVSPKVGLSNQHHGDARAVVFTFVGLPAPQTPTFTWKLATFTTQTDYEQMYNQALTALNGLPLPSAQASIVTMTNMEDGDATLTIFYPTT